MANTPPVTPPQTPPQEIQPPRKSSASRSAVPVATAATTTATATAPAGTERPPTLSDTDLQAVSNLKAAHAAIKSEMSKVIVGQHDVLDQVLMAIFTKSHALLVGVPGLAKTLMISTLA